MTLKKTLAGAAAAAAIFAAGVSLAQAEFPEKPITLVAGFAAGGSTDILTRAIAPKMSEVLGVPVVVENRPGADSNIAAEMVANAEPDGYTVLSTTNSIPINVHLYPDQAYDPLTDLAPVGLIGDSPNVVVVNSSLGVDSLDELVALSKEQDLFYGATASGTALATELLKRSSGLEASRIPYKGAGAAVPALLGGEVQLMLTGIINVLPHLEAGTLTPIVVTSAERSPLIPETPTVAESGLPGYSDAIWNGLYVPAGTPPEVIAKLNEALNAALNDPEIKASIEKLSTTVKPGTPEDLGELTKSDIERWGALIKEQNISFN
jgi:tripartite-type tricarboxylate transporter receptor subunit TctC